MLARRRVPAMILVGFWTVVGLIYVVARYAAHAVRGTDFGAGQALWTMAGWYTWVPASLIALALARHVRIGRDTWYWALPLHTVAAAGNSLLASLLYTGMRATAARFGGAPIDDAGTYVRDVFLGSVALDSLLYLTILVAVHAFEYYRRYSAERLRTARLTAELTEARLQALKMQLHPHFLFNTFNTISMLVRRRRQAQAVEMIASLSSFLRYVLDHTDLQVVPIDEEINLLNSYLAIEHIRFGDRLTARVEIAPDVHQALVPTLLLQPLVENAIRHGVEPVERPGTVTVVVRRRDEVLDIVVSDDGLGLQDDWLRSPGFGTGLRNTKARLERLYGPDHTLSLRRAAEGRGTTVALSIPFRTADGLLPEAGAPSHVPHEPAASTWPV